MINVGIIKTNKGNVEVLKKEYPFNDQIIIKYETGQWSDAIKIDVNRMLVCEILEDVSQYISKKFDYKIKGTRVAGF